MISDFKLFDLISRLKKVETAKSSQSRVYDQNKKANSEKRAPKVLTKEEKMKLIDLAIQKTKEENR